MKAAALILLFAVCYVECRKIIPTITKTANVDFINMESGGVRGKPAAVEPPKPAAPAAPTPTPAPVAKPSVPQAPTPAPTPAPTTKPAVQQPPKPVQTVPSPTQVRPVPVNPAPAANPVTTPGPGSVKSLITFYDSQGKGSVVRPYSYSQAVKQG